MADMAKFKSLTSKIVGDTPPTGALDPLHSQSSNEFRKGN